MLNQTKEKIRMQNITELTGPNIEWEKYGSGFNENTPEAYLTSWVKILGIDFHASAIQVDEEGDAIAIELQDDLERLHAINATDSGDHFYTVKIEGRNYVVFFHPFAN